MEFFLLICCFVLLVMVLTYRSKQKEERLEDRERVRELTTRIYFLEELVKKLKHQVEAGVRPAEPSEESAPAKAPVAEPAASVKAPEPVAPVRAPASAPPPKPPQITPPPAVAPVEVRREPVTPPRPVAPPQFAAPKPQRPPVQIKSLVDRMEDTLGRNWLGKIGISLVVLGVAFFLALQLPKLGPAGKALVGFGTSALLLGGGIWLEYKERYRILARALIGGGWALLFFLTWAIHYVPATAIIDSASLDFLLMFVTAIAMVLHTLHYRSQAVTGLAYLLAFLTVGINHADATSLIAGVLLAGGLVVLVGRYQWYELEVAGIFASYLNHYLWLRPIIEPMQGMHHPFPEYTTSAGLLVLYWLIFRMSYVVRGPSTADRERISTVAALLNPLLFMTLLKYQSIHPEWTFWALLAFGAVETLLGQLPVTRRRRTAVIVLSTLGVVLLIAAFPFRYSGTNLSVLWLLEAEALLLIGIWSREIVFRRLGLLAALLVSGHMVVVDAYHEYLAHALRPTVPSNPQLAIVFALASLVFYADAHWVSRRWRDLFASAFDRQVLQRLSYIAALMAFIAVWMAFPETWTAVGWCALAAVLAWAGRRWAIGEVFYQGNVLAAAGVVRALVVNLDATQTYGHFSLRLITISIIAALLYLTAHWGWEIGGVARTTGSRRFANGAYTWTATFLLALLAWYEVDSVAVAVVWAAGGLLLALIARWMVRPDLTYQANALAVAAVIRTVMINYHADQPFHGVTQRLASVLGVAVILYVTSRWGWVDESGDREFFLGSTGFPFSSVAAGTYVWAGSFLLSLLAWYELQPVSVAVAWAVGGLVLLELGLGRKRVSFRAQAYVAFVSAFARIFFVNLNAGGEGITPRMYTVVPISLIFFYAYWRLRDGRPSLRLSEQKALPEFCCWLGTVALAALLRFEVLPDWVATAWAALALGLIFIARIGNQRVFLHQALLLSVGILFRTVLHNFYQRSYFPPDNFWQTRWVLTGSTVVLMFLALPLLFQLRKKGAEARGLAVLDRRPEQLFFFIAVGLLSTMLALEMNHGMVTLAWGLEGVAIFLIALWAGERSFRLTGLGLLMLCVAKILVRDIWQLQLGDRYLTLVVLGAALVLVSFLYTRYAEKIRQFL